MARELSELLADSVEARTRSVAGLAPAPDDMATVVQTVRRRRVVRRTLQTLAVVPIVAGVAAGAYLGLGALQSPPTPPAQTPDVVVPAPEPGELKLGDLVTEPGLPPFHEAPANLRAYVGAGWAALTYRPLGADDGAPVAHTVLLASPDGALVRTADLPPELEVSLVHWDAASERARVTWTGGSQRPVTTGWLDVFTGELDEDPEQFEAWAQFLGHDAAGAELWVEDPTEGRAPTVWAIGPDGARREVAALVVEGTPRLDPSGRTLLVPGTHPSLELGLVDVDSGEVREVAYGMGDRMCGVVGWLDATSLALLCHDPVTEEEAAALDRVDMVAQRATLYALDIAGTSTPLHTFAEGEPVPAVWSGARAVSGELVYVVMSGFPGGCSQGVALWDGQAPRAVLGAGEHGANTFLVREAGEHVLVVSSGSCESDSVQAEVTVLDALTGSTRVLTPWVEGDWQQTVTSAAVAR